MDSAVQLVIFPRDGGKGVRLRVRCQRLHPSASTQEEMIVGEVQEIRDERGATDPHIQHFIFILFQRRSRATRRLKIGPAPLSNGFPHGWSWCGCRNLQDSQPRVEAERDDLTSPASPCKHCGPEPGKNSRFIRRSHAWYDIRSFTETLYLLQVSGSTNGNLIFQI